MLYIDVTGMYALNKISSKFAFVVSTFKETLVIRCNGPAIVVPEGYIHVEYLAISISFHDKVLYVYELPYKYKEY